MPWACILRVCWLTRFHTTAAAKYYYYYCSCCIIFASLMIYVVDHFLVDMINTYMYVFETALSRSSSSSSRAVSLYPPADTHNIYQNDKPIPTPRSQMMNTSNRCTSPEFDEQRRAGFCFSAAT